MTLILDLLVLLTLANGIPVIAKRLLGRRFAFPLDAGIILVDGQPLFGASKTVRGVVLSIIVTAVSAPLLGLSWQTGAIIGSVAMLGDLISSFIKRRMKLPPSSQTPGLDQIPETLLPLLACQQMLALTVSDILIVTVIFFVGAQLLSRLLYRLNIRDHPY